MSKSIPNLDAANFGKSGAEELQRRGLGAPSKRELEALLLHLLEKHSALGELSNHDAGLLLRAQAQRIKTLRHEATLRFEEDVERVAGDRLAAAIKTGRYDSGSDMVILVIEDAFGREAVLASLKQHGGYGDWKGGNSEIIQAKSELVTTILQASLPEDEVGKFVSAVNKGKRRASPQSVKSDHGGGLFRDEGPGGRRRRRSRHGFRRCPHRRLGAPCTRCDSDRESDRNLNRGYTDSVSSTRGSTPVRAYRAESSTSHRARRRFIEDGKPAPL